MAMMRVPRGQGVMAVLVGPPGEEETIYFTAESEDEVRRLLGDPVETALSLAGAWSDLDEDEVLRELDRLRHESPPTPIVDNIDGD